MKKKKDATLEKFWKPKLNTDHLIFKSLRNKIPNNSESLKAKFFLNIINDVKGH